MTRENPFGASLPPRCVVMAGGRSRRFASIGGHKSMALVRGMPVISHVVEYWRQYTDDFIFVVKNGKEALTEFVRTLPISAEFIEPAALRGIADGLGYVEGMVDAPFIVVLGDCYCKGEFTFAPGLSYGIGVQRGAQAEGIRRNYSVLVEGSKVLGVEEKPQEVRNDLCGMGFYFFQPDVFDYIRKTGPSARTQEREITDVLQTIIDDGRDLSALMFDGAYVNVNTLEDIADIAAFLGET